MTADQKEMKKLKLEVNTLREEIAYLQSREEGLERIKSELTDTLENLTIHQEELRTQNDELRRIQEHLEESTRRYRDLFERAPIGYFILDDQGIIKEVNKRGAALLGYDASYLQTKPFLLYLTPSSRKIFSSHLRKISGPIHSSSAEIECLQGSGHTLPIHIESVLTDDRFGQKKLFRTAVLDISQRKKAEAILVRTERQLRQALKMEAVGTLAGGIAHDFNNILSAMLGYSDLTLAKLPADSPLRKYLQEVLTAGFRAKNLVKQILVFSRQTEQEKQPVNLKYLIQEAIQLLKAILPSTIRLESRFLLEETVHVLADPTELHQVVINLCTNAEHSMRETGGVLTIQLERFDVSPEFSQAHPPLKPTSHIRLTVQDEGCGISPKIQLRMFDPFFTTKNVGEGTGMGLSVVHGIVTQLNGIIMLEHTNSEGTMFGVYLPLYTGPVQSSHDLSVSTPRKRGRILFIDDEEPLARMGEQMLKQLGYDSIACTSGEEGLALFEAKPDEFDMVVVDQTMPKVTGEAVARCLLAKRPELPVILCTGYSHVMTPERAHSVGIRSFLMKPLLAHELDKAIQEGLSRTNE